MVPVYSTHVIGCGGIIVNDGKVLLVEEKSVSNQLFREHSKVNSEYLEAEQILQKVFKNVQRDRFLRKSA